MMAVDISPAHRGTPWSRSKSTKSLSSLSLVALSRPSTPKPTPPRQKTGFLDLPYEIRTMIYAAYLPSTFSQKKSAPIDRIARDVAKGYQYRGHAGKWTRLNSPYHHVRNLLVASRQIYYEVMGEILNRFRISVPCIFEMRRDARSARELETVFAEFVGKGHMIRHLEVDGEPKGVAVRRMSSSSSPCTDVVAMSTSTSRSSSQSQDLNFDSIADLDLNQEVWDCLLPGLASIKINVSPARLPEEWAGKVLAILRYVDASVTERCVVEVHAKTRQDRKMIEGAMTHPRLKVVVQAEEEEEWFEAHGSSD